MACSSENVACDAHDDNYLQSIGGVGAVEECRQLCEDYEGNCQFITYYGPESFPYKSVCNMFSSCPDVHDCVDCVSEDIYCNQTLCGEHHVGVIEDNLLQTLVDVETEADCKNYCRHMYGCAFYTYFFKEDPNPKLCVLLSHLIEPLQPCDTCVTGPLECNNTETTTSVTTTPSTTTTAPLTTTSPQLKG